MPLDIIIDTREQAPWAWEPNQATTRVHGLAAGDYALSDDCYPLDDKRKTLGVKFAIERKSLDDFIGTISTGWERFGRELERMAQFPAKVMIVEGNFEECCFVTDSGGKERGPMHNHPRITPPFVAKRISELTLRRVSVLFAGDAGLAAGLAWSIFHERAKQCS
jgi:hypothetical protein